MTPRYIVVEGVIGVGKTTVVKALAERLHARTVYEVFEENPFLAKFYQDRERHAFATEMFFLLSRYNQQETFAQEDLLQRYSVSDYLFEKCRLFASVTLSEAELTLFDRMYEILARQVPKPDLVVHLKAPVDALLERIANRGRGYEADIAPDYLADLDQQYDELLARFDACPVLKVDTTQLDLREDDAVDALLERIARGRSVQDTDAPFLLEG